MKLPVQSAVNVQNPEPSAAADNNGVSPPKSLPKSVDSGEATTDDFQKNDSLVEETSDWSDGEDAAAVRGLPIAQLPSGLCYDVQMRYHCEVRPTADVHPEDPRRIYYIYKELCRAGLVDDPESSKPLVSRPLKRISARNATEEEVSLVHTPGHYAFVESTKGKR
jgi:histone deacetylase 6